MGVSNESMKETSDLHRCMGSSVSAMPAALVTSILSQNDFGYTQATKQNDIININKYGLININ